MDYRYIWINVLASEIDEFVPENFPDVELDDSFRTWRQYFRRVVEQADGNYVCLTGHYPNGINRPNDVTEEECKRFLDHFGEDRICEAPVETIEE